MNKAYRQVYKDGIGWVAIAENASCVSSSKGSGTVSSKTKVEVLKSFFDLRNSVVLNNGFLLKGLFAATLFCGVFVGDLKADPSLNEAVNIQDKAVSTGGTAVYVDDGGKRFIQNKQGGYIDTEGKGLIKIKGQWYRVDKYDEKGVMTLSDGKKYVIPTGTLNAILHDDAYNPSMVKNLAAQAKVPFFYNIEDTISPSDSNKLVRYDENDKKWYVYNTNGERLYLTKRKDTGKFGLHKFSELEKNSDGIPIQDEKGYYMLITPVSSSYAAGEVERSIGLDELSQDLHKLNETPDFNKNKPTRLGLVGLDGINTMPKIYTKDDKTNGKIPDGRNVGDNKDGNIRLGNVAKALKDDEAVNLGQLNETLKNLNTGTGKVPYVHINSSIKGSGSNYDSDGAKGNNSIAIGPNAIVNTNAASSVALGYGATVETGATNALAFGSNAMVKSKDSVSIGTNTKTGAQSIAIGLNAITNNAYIEAAKKDNEIDRKRLMKYRDKAIKESGGKGAAYEIKEKFDETFFIESLGRYVTKEKMNEFCNPADTTLRAQRSKECSAARHRPENQRYYEKTPQIYENSIAIGTNAKTFNHNSIAIGLNAVAYDKNSIAIGKYSLAAAEGSVAIGEGSVAELRHDKLKGYMADNDTAAWKATRQSFAVGDAAENVTRQITGVAAGHDDTDAVNVAQLKTGLNSKANKTEIQALAQDAVKVANGTNTTVETDTSVAGKTTYKVNVKLDEYAKSADIDTKLGGYVKSVKGDKFINVDSNDKQNPALTLNTTELAKDNTFVTNIAGNSVFKDTYVTNDKLADSGFKFTGDDATKKIDKKLGGTISIKGGADSELSDKNIGVVAVNNSLQVKLAKNLLGLESTEFKKGSDTTTVSAEEGVSTTKTLKVTDSGGNTVAEIDNTQIQIKDASGKTVTSINSAINNLYATTKGLTSDNALAVKYDSSTKEKIMLGGSGATKQVAIKNLASAGDINDVNNKFNAVNAGDLKTALSGVNNSIDNINNRNFTSLSVSANGGTKYDIRASENIDFTGDKGINVNYNATNNKFTFSADINSIAGNIADNNAFSNKYAMLDGSNLKPANGFDQGTWRTALGLTDSNIASIFEGGTDITITPNGNKYTIAYTGTGGGTGTGGIDQDKVRKIIREYIGGNNIGSTDGSSDNIVTHDVKERKTTNNKNIIAAINRINKYGIGFVHVNGDDITPDPTTGISANDSSAEGKNAIAIGPKSRAVGNNSIAIGVRNVVTGNNSGAFGDPSIIAGSDSYSVGNNNTVKSNDTFVLGNKVTVGADMQGAVVLGSGSTAVDKAIEVSRAEVNGITYDGFKGQAAGGMILSVGAKGAERQIKNVAAGQISENSTDAVNGSQLHATNKIIGNVANSVKNVIGGNAKVNKDGEISASNIGGTDQPTINDAIASINNKINSGGKSYIAIDVPTNGGGVPIASKGSNSIVIGAGSSDNGRKNVVSVGNAKTGLNRTITNVAPGKYGTDAVNMNQLYGVAGGLSKQINDVKKKSSAGIAGAVALGMLPQSNIPGDALVSIGTGYHDSESAVALGISKTSDNARWIFKGGVSYDSQDEVTAGASVGFHF